MPRIQHVIRENKRSAIPSQVIYYDTETHLDKSQEGITVQNLWFGIANYADYGGHGKEEECLFTTPEEFWSFVESKCRDSQKLVLLSHNQDFDFRVLHGFTCLAKRGWELTGLIHEQGKFIADYRKEESESNDGTERRKKKKRNAVYYLSVLDTLNWFKSSLAELGKTLKIDKLTMPEGEGLSDNWITYCRRDVLILRRAFECFVKFLQDSDMGNFAPTLAKQASNAYRHRFMHYPIWVHTNERAISLERDAYYGGRTDCYYIGNESKGVYYKLDINSQYPFVMRENRYPSQLMGYRAVVDREYFESPPKNTTFIALCDIETNVRCVPHRYNNRLCFPVGRFTSALCEPEYRIAERVGAKLTVKRIAYYHTEPLFTEWVDSVYAMRRRFKAEGNKQYDYFTKLLMNSLYGKFGQRVDEWKIVSDIDPSENWTRTIEDFETGKIQKLRALGGKLWEKAGWKEGYDTMVAIAAFVTCYARCYLWRLIDTADLTNCYYSDTDSLIVNEEGFERLKPYCDREKLGYLKLEAIDFQITINNLKDYSFAGETVLKGVPRKAVQLDENSYRCEQWQHLSGALRDGSPERVIVKDVIKNIARTYEKGTVAESGRTVPFELNEL